MIILELIEFVGLPVDSVHCAVEWVSNGWHLKWKDVVLELVVGLADGIGLCVQEESLI